MNDGLGLENVPGFSLENSVGLEEKNIFSCGKRVGEGREFVVYEVMGDSSLVMKVPVNSREAAWADGNMTIPAYHMAIYSRLRKIAIARDYIPERFETGHTSGGEEVIITDNLIQHGGEVFALGDFSGDASEKIGIKARLLNSGITVGSVERFVAEARQLIGNRLLDEVSLQKLLISPDSFLIVVDKNGRPSLSLSDFGTILDTSNLNSDQINEQKVRHYTSILFSLAFFKSMVNSLWSDSG